MCDGIQNCNDGSDETGCGKFKISLKKCYGSISYIIQTTGHADSMNSLADPEAVAFPSFGSVMVDHSVWMDQMSTTVLQVNAVKILSTVQNKMRAYQRVGHVMENPTV